VLADAPGEVEARELALRRFALGDRLDYDKETLY
jgi:hypothetical protein